jgi:glycosyltransferase involved in cell wall biosynthesis
VRGEIRGRDLRRGRAVYEAAQAVKYLQGLGHDAPVVAAYYPALPNNPYQALLYSGFWEQGIAPVPLGQLEELGALTALQAAGARVVLHHHWTNFVLNPARNDSDARERIARHLGMIDQFLADGGRVVWTVHNILPHKVALPEREVELRRGLVARASLVHVMAAQTRELVAERYEIPAAKELHIPIPNYMNAYETYISRDEARYQLGLWPDQIVYAFLGSIRSYKALDELIDAFDRVSRKDPGRRQLLVAGNPSDEPGVDDFLDRCLLHPFISLHAGRVPPEDMQLFLRAADVVLLPYVRSLNSAVLMMALSFGLPVVAPDIGGMSELVTPEVGRIYRSGDTEALAAAIESADTLVGNPDAREAALRIARAHDPIELSHRFARALLDRLDWTAPSARRPAGEDAGARVEVGSSTG